MRRHVQPYRAASRRSQSPALRAMQRGSGPLPHLQNARRKALKRKRTRKSRARYSSPLQKILRTRQKVQG